MKMKTITKDFSYRDRHFYIVYDGKYYMTIEHKFVDADGHLLKELAYTDGLHTNATLDGCMEDTKRALDIDYLVQNGYSKKEAFAEVMHIDIAVLDAIDF